MSKLKKVLIREVGLREGMQSSTCEVELQSKLEIVKLLNQTGIKNIELTSFVRPELVPQMKDASDLVARYERKPGIKYSALYLNQKGFELAEQTGRLDNDGWLYCSVSSNFFRRNYNLTLETFVASIPVWSKLFEKYSKPLRGLMVSCAFGSYAEGSFSDRQVIDCLEPIMEALAALNSLPTEISLADTVGLANPESVKRLVANLKVKFPDIRLSLHLHDTRGLGLANAYAGLEEGVDCFEASVGGVGGCPFTKGASGNVATEDLVYLCESLGFETGIDLKAYVEVACYLESILGAKSLSGRYYRIEPSLP